MGAGVELASIKMAVREQVGGQDPWGGGGGGGGGGDGQHQDGGRGAGGRGFMVHKLDVLHQATVKSPPPPFLAVCHLPHVPPLHPSRRL